MNIWEVYRGARVNLGRFLSRFSVGKKMLMAWRGHASSSANARRRQEILASNAPRISSEACNALGAAGIDAWLCAGSLLGAVRDGGFIPWDNDIDLFVIAEGEPLWIRIEDALSNAGFAKIREFERNGRVTEQAYLAGDVTFDVYGIDITNDTHGKVYMYERQENVKHVSWRDVEVLYLPIELPKGKRYIQVDEYDLPVPENAEAILCAYYGTDWRVPNPAFRAGTMFTLDKSAQGRLALFIR